MKTYTAIKAEIARLEMQAEALRKTEIAGVIGRIKEAIAAYGLTATDLGLSGAAARVAPPPKGKGRKEAAPTVGTPRYRDPKTGATWTGRGRPPAWLAAAGNRDRFLIGAPAAPTPDPTSGEPAREGARKPRAAAKGAGAKSASTPKPSGLTGKKAASRGKTPAVRSETGAAPE